ncbi:MAG: transcriptional repressor [Actinomycetales bacterium]|nr:transcriptional repressor [Actinomycetales bacterium]
MSPAGAGRRTPRRTRQRQAVADLLAAHPGFISAQRVHSLLAEGGIEVGLATVYRCLAQMVAGGELDTIVAESAEVLYRRCSADHHHHLVCRRCGTTVEVHDPQVESWADGVARAHGFADVNHRVEVMGVCRACAL